ncbi:MAG: hypothetical protein IPM82_29375 [Saprospiraceae bacterium]|nr:hypothetical protein [Saprospiraceae bacterium]
MSKATQPEPVAEGFGRLKVGTPAEVSEVEDPPCSRAKAAKKNPLLFVQPGVADDCPDIYSVGSKSSSRTTNGRPSSTSLPTRLALSLFDKGGKNVEKLVKAFISGVPTPRRCTVGWWPNRSPSPANRATYCPATPTQAG